MVILEAVLVVGLLVVAQEEGMFLVVEFLVVESLVQCSLLQQPVL